MDFWIQLGCGGFLDVIRDKVYFSDVDRDLWPGQTPVINFNAEFIGENLE